jgi:hypothetical protein
VDPAATMMVGLLRIGSMSQAVVISMKPMGALASRPITLKALIIIV